MRIPSNSVSRRASVSMQFKILMIVPLLIGLVACNQGRLNKVNPPTQQTTQASVISPSQTQLPSQGVTALPTLKPARLLTICLINEPRSLFLYDAVSTSEQSVLAAIYDGPIDIKNFIANPVILEKIPSLANGDALLQSVQVGTGDLIVDAQGNLTNLEDGVLYRPSGCTRARVCTDLFRHRPCGDGPACIAVQAAAGFTMVGWHTP